MQNNITERVIKCLRMAHSQVNENEAANALRLAKKLAAQHGLDIAELESERQHKEKSDISYKMMKQAAKSKRGYLKYEKILFHVCDNLFGTKHFQHLINKKAFRQATMVVIGTPIDVKLSLTVFDILKRMAERNARKLYGYKWSRIHRSYSEGFMGKLLERSEEEVEFDEVETSNCLDLVLQNKEQQVNSFWDKLYKDLKLKDGKSKKSKINVSAYVQGNEDAEDVDLNFKESISVTG